MHASSKKLPFLQEQLYYKTYKVLKAYGLSRHDAIDRCHIPEDCDIYIQCCENVKSKFN